MGCHQIVLRHDLLHGTVETALKAQVAVCHDTHEVLVVVDHGDTSDMILRHDVQSLCHRRSQGDRDRIIDHAVLSTLHDSHLTRLVLDGHILVNNTDTTFTCNGDGHLRLCHSIHGSRHKRHVQLNVARETGFQLYCLGQYLRISRNQQDVVECKTIHHDFVCNK